jgi:hypothetical protein
MRDMILRSAIQDPGWAGNMSAKKDVGSSNEQGQLLVPLVALNKPPTVNCEVDTFVSPAYST